MLKPLSLLVFAVFSLQASDDWVGTWKLDPARSEFVNIDKWKDFTIVVTEEGDYHVLQVTLTTSNGKVEHNTFKQPNKGGKLIPIGNSQVENEVVEILNDHEWVYKYYTNAGKLEATQYVKLSKDGKTTEEDMRGMDNGKKFVQHVIMVKQ